MSFRFVVQPLRQVTTWTKCHWALQVRVSGDSSRDSVSVVECSASDCSEPPGSNAMEADFSPSNFSRDIPSPGNFQRDIPSLGYCWGWEDVMVCLCLFHVSSQFFLCIMYVYCGVLLSEAIQAEQQPWAFKDIDVWIRGWLSFRAAMLQ